MARAMAVCPPFFSPVSMLRGPREGVRSSPDTRSWGQGHVLHGARHRRPGRAGCGCGCGRARTHRQCTLTMPPGARRVLGTPKGVNLGDGGPRKCPLQSGFGQVTLLLQLPWLRCLRGRSLPGSAGVSWGQPAAAVHSCLGTSEKMHRVGDRWAWLSHPPRRVPVPHVTQTWAIPCPVTPLGAPGSEASAGDVSQ